LNKYLPKIIIKLLCIILNSIKERGMHLKKYNDTQNTITSFFGVTKNEIELDESTFNCWKNELQKELPLFWEEVNSYKK
jgi:hypothetical protein